MATRRLWSRCPPSEASIISIAGVAGGLGGAGIDLIAQPDSEEALIGIPLLGSIIGLAIGAAASQEESGGADGRGGANDGGGAANDRAETLLPGALLNWSDGGFAASAPLPDIRLLPSNRRGRRAQSPSLVIPLVQIRFGS